MRAPAVMASPVFRYYFGAQTVSSFGSAMSWLAVTFAILRIGGSAADLGVVLAAGAVPSLLLMLFGGVAGDRWERRRILIIADLVMAAVMASLAALLLTGHAMVWHFFVAELVGGAAAAFSWPAGVGIYPTLVPTEQIQPGKSLLGMGNNTAQILGPPVAGILVAVASSGWALAADAASFLISAALLSRLPRSRGAVQAGLSVWSDVRAGWREFVSRRWVWLMVLSFATYQATVLPAIFVLGPVFARDHLDGASSWAWILSARAVGAILVGLVLLRWRPRRPLVASTAVILLDIPFLAVLAIGLPLPVVVVTAAVSSAGVVAADTVGVDVPGAGPPGGHVSGELVRSSGLELYQPVGLRPDRRRRRPVRGGPGARRGVGGTGAGPHRADREPVHPVRQARRACSGPSGCGGRLSDPRLAPSESPGRLDRLGVHKNR